MGADPGQDDNALVGGVDDHDGSAVENEVPRFVQRDVFLADDELALLFRLCRDGGKIPEERIEEGSESAAAESGVAMEINAHPSRLDLDDAYPRRAKEMGIPISINTDAHSEEDMDMRFYGVAVARRAWLTRNDVINCWSTDKLLKWLKNRK